LLCREDLVGDREREREALFGATVVLWKEVCDRMVVLVDSYFTIVAVNSFGAIFLDIE
jgi:hypothetical protein